MAQFKRNLSQYTIYFCILLAAIFIYSSKRWEKEKHVIEADVISYYAYLPATFIFHDIKLEKKETFEKGIFWPEVTPDGAKVIKTTMGISVLYSPFFFVSHAYSKMMGYSSFGYSPVYKIGLLFSALFYFFIGLIFLRKVLKIYFPEKITALILVAVALGTNLFYYVTREAAMPHVYNFFLFNVFIWGTIKWHQTPRPGRLLFLGALAGLITLARPSNIIILLFFFLYGVYSKDTFVRKIKMVFSQSHWFVLMGVVFIAVWIPQLLYWKTLTGDFFFYSYTGERFFFNNPHFIDGLFSYRKGWLVYTPIMFFFFIGILFSFKKWKEISLAVAVFTIVNMYVIFSWWCWWYGGSFGMRPMIDSYGLLSLPMGLFFAEVYRFRKSLYKILLGICLILILQNFFYMRKYRSGSIHWDSMTKEAFWNSYWRFGPLPAFWDLLEKPDYEKARQGEDAIIEEQDQ
jgi:hypothetical protein